jgi:hypothetical protein
VTAVNQNHWRIEFVNAGPPGFAVRFRDHD